MNFVVVFFFNGEELCTQAHLTFCFSSLTLHTLTQFNKHTKYINKRE